MKSKFVWLVALVMCAAIAWFVVSRRARKKVPMTLQAEIERCTALGRKLQDLLVGKQLVLGTTPQRDKLLASYWALVVDYHEGMLGLMRQKLYGSAFALLRPTVEALVRAHVVLMASQDVVDEIIADDYKTNFKTIGAEIDTAFGYKRPEAEQGLFEKFLHEEGRGVLHAFTHSGLPQLGRRFNGADLDVTFEDEEIINFAHISTSVLWMVTNLLTNQFGFKEESKEADRLFREWGAGNAATSTAAAS
jgi:hypothetical protein